MVDKRRTSKFITSSALSVSSPSQGDFVMLKWAYGKSKLYDHIIWHNTINSFQMSMIHIMTNLTVYPFLSPEWSLDIILGGSASDTEDFIQVARSECRHQLRFHVTCHLNFEYDAPLSIIHYPLSINIYININLITWYQINYCQVVLTVEFPNVHPVRNIWWSCHIIIRNISSL